MTGELDEDAGSKAWFEAFDIIKNEIMRPDRLASWIGKDLIEGKKILDLGCGPGFWCRSVRGIDTAYHGIDISPRSVELARLSAEIFNASCNISVGNAENIDYPDCTFDHVISEGVIHHTPDTRKAAHEIIRVLKVGGTATVSVYYKNILLSNKFLFGAARTLMGLLNLHMKGRSREVMSKMESPDEFIRTYDGAGNPVGRGYSRDEARALFPGNCQILYTYKYYSPLRPLFRHRFNTINNHLDNVLGLMLTIHLKKTAERG